MKTEQLEKIIADNNLRADLQSSVVKAAQGSQWLYRELMWRLRTPDEVSLDTKLGKTSAHSGTSWNNQYLQSQADRDCGLSDADAEDSNDFERKNK